MERAVRNKGEITHSCIKFTLRAAADAIPALLRKPTTGIILNQQFPSAPAMATIIKHQMKGAVCSVWLLYDEWKGLRDFEGVPVNGGLEAL